MLQKAIMHKERTPMRFWENLIGVLLVQSTSALRLITNCRESSVKPFAEVVGNYTCRDRNQKCYKNILHNTPPSVTISVGGVQ